MKSVIVIPAFNPDNRLHELVTELRRLEAPQIVVVDDGSSPECQPLFEQLETGQGCVICRHNKNLGKGAALKTGMSEVLRLSPFCTGCITTDADGQHSPGDIVRVSKALEAYPDSLVLGTRVFSGSDVPFRSRWGNRITALVFHVATRVRCRDTQTGLRGIPAVFMQKCLEIPGNRFEYEMNFLLEAAMQKIPFVEVPIRTIYLESNRSSHFRPFWDSARIYLNLFKFGLSSMVSAAVDITLFTLLVKLKFGASASGLLTATVLARMLSGCANFLLNKKWVFAGRGNVHGEAVKYFALFCGQMLASWLMVALLSSFAIPVVLAKLLSDGGLFLISYFIQRKYIFYPAKPNAPGERSRS